MNTRGKPRTRDARKAAATSGAASAASPDLSAYLTSTPTNTMIECRCNGARAIIEPGSQNTAWTTYFDDPVIVKQGDEIACTLGVVQSTSGTSEAIEIVEGVNDTGLVKLCFYYGDCQTLGPLTPITDLGSVFSSYDQARIPRWNTYTTGVDDSDPSVYLATKIGGRPFSPDQIQRCGTQAGPHTQMNYHWTTSPTLGNRYRPHYPSSAIIVNTDTTTPANNVPFESIFTITVPAGFYSPTELADYINKYINQTFVKHTVYSCLLGEYSSPSAPPTQVYFYPEVGVCSINRMTMLKYCRKFTNYDYDDGSVDGRSYADYQPGPGNPTNPDKFSQFYGMWCVDEYKGQSDPNGNPYGLARKNWSYGQMAKGIWEQPFLIGGLFAQFNFNPNSGKFEWSNLHTPMPSSSTGTNLATSTSVLTPAYTMATFDNQPSSGFVRTINCAAGGCGIKLKGSLWETLGFTTATDAQWNYTVIDDTYLNTFSFTITDPFTSTMWGLVNVEPSGSGAFEFSTQVDLAGENAALQTSQYARFNPNIGVQLSDQNNFTGNPIPKIYGERAWDWNSTVVAAQNFAQKISGGYYLVQSDILGNELCYTSENGKKLPIVGIIMKNYSNDDWWYSFNSMVPFVVKQDRVIRSIYIRLLNPDFTQPSNLGPATSIIFSITSQFQMTQWQETPPRPVGAPRQITQNLEEVEEEGRETS